MGYGGLWVNTPLHRVSGKQPPGSNLRRTEPLNMGTSSKCSPGLVFHPSQLPHSRSFDSIPRINHLNTGRHIRSCSGGEAKFTSLSSGNGVLGRLCEQLLSTRILRSKDMYFLALELAHSLLPGARACVVKDGLVVSWKEPEPQGFCRVELLYQHWMLIYALLDEKYTPILLKPLLVKAWLSVASLLWHLTHTIEAVSHAPCWSLLHQGCKVTVQSPDTWVSCFVQTRRKS